MWNVNDGWMIEHRPWHQLTYSKAPCKLTTENFQDGRLGGHFGYRNKMLLAIMNLYVTPMPPIKFRLNQTYYSGDEV